MNEIPTGKPDSRESGLVQRLRRAVHDLPVSKPHVLLACSGGKDSVALAALLAEMQRLTLLTFSIGHVYHGQHDMAEAAAASVRQIANDLGVQFGLERLDPELIRSHGGVGLEEAMRRERYRALARMAHGAKADCIALAHHQTDQAETILLHLMRGTGVDGLAGMRAWEPRQIPWWTDKAGHEIPLWRPLLKESAATVAGIAHESGLPVVEDPTNVDIAYRRNAIRNRLLPVIEEVAEGATEAIARSAEVVAQDASILQRLTKEALQDCVTADGISRVSLMEYSAELQMRVIRAWIALRAPSLELGHDRIVAIQRMCLHNRGGSRIEIGYGESIVLKKGILQWETCENSYDDM